MGCVHVAFEAVDFLFLRLHPLEEQSVGSFDQRPSEWESEKFGGQKELLGVFEKVCLGIDWEMLKVEDQIGEKALILGER